MDALTARHGLDLHKRFSCATVAVCGLGGLGSNIAIALARAGIGKLLLIDFDRVDITNLHRQQYKANQIGLYKADALAENLLEIAPLLAPGENRHFEPGENSQFQPGRNRQSVPGGCSQPRFGYRF